LYYLGSVVHSFAELVSRNNFLPRPWSGERMPIVRIIESVIQFDLYKYFTFYKIKFSCNSS
jgi:hypothetical protein